MENAVEKAGFITTFLPPDEYLALPRSPETWVIKPLIPAGGLVNLYGSPKVGKSYLAIQLSLAISQGDGEWLGFPIHTPGPVCYLQLDTPRSLWAERLDDLGRAGVSLTGGRSDLYLADAEQAPYPFDILNPDKGLAWLAQQVEAIQPVMVVVDTLRECHIGDENDSAQMKNVMSNLVAATRPSALLIVSHARKDNPQFGESLLNDNRGSSYVAGRMDSIIRINHKTMSYQGRAVEECRMPLRRMDNGFWTLGVEEEPAIRRVLADTSLHSLRERAEKLAEILGKSTEAARSILRRRVEAGPVEGVNPPTNPIEIARV